MIELSEEEANEELRKYEERRKILHEESKETSEAAKAMSKFWGKALQKGYEIKTEMVKEGIIDAQVKLAIENNQTYREFSYKEGKFAIKLIGFGTWNLYQQG